MTQIFSWNVNGYRSCLKKNFLNWLETNDADLVCLQETKVDPVSQLEEFHRNPHGYQSVWATAEKKGYSGVAVLYRKQPLNIVTGIGLPIFDREGRTLTLEFEKFFLINSYFPNGQRDHGRVPFKLEYCQAIVEFCNGLRRQNKEVIICGDFNTAHQAIDLRNAKTNVNTTGFLPIERAWVDAFIEQGYIDIFRRLRPEPNHYTWWSYRPGVRGRNIGWRIDYFFITPGLLTGIEAATIHPEILGSDHCPIGLKLK